MASEMLAEVLSRAPPTGDYLWAALAAAPDTADAFHGVPGKRLAGAGGGMPIVPPRVR